MKRKYSTDGVMAPLDFAAPTLNTNVPSLSGDFIRMSELGMLEEISRLYWKAQRALRRREEVDQELRNCNKRPWLFKFEEQCRRQRVDDFASALRRRAGELEKERSALNATLGSIHARFLEIEPSMAPFAEVTDPMSVAALPRAIRTPAKRQGSPAVASRNAVIDANVKRSDQEICRRLDFEFPLRNGRAPQELTGSWQRKYEVTSFTQAYTDKHCRPLVQTMISKRRKLVTRNR